MKDEECNPFNYRLPVTDIPNLVSLTLTSVLTGISTYFGPLRGASTGQLGGPVSVLLSFLGLCLHFKFVSKENLCNYDPQGRRLVSNATLQPYFTRRYANDLLPRARWSWLIAKLKIIFFFSTLCLLRLWLRRPRGITGTAAWSASSAAAADLPGIDTCVTSLILEDYENLFEQFVNFFFYTKSSRMNILE